MRAHNSRYIPIERPSRHVVVGDNITVRLCTVSVTRAFFRFRRERERVRYAHAVSLSLDTISRRRHLSLRSRRNLRNLRSHRVRRRAIDVANETASCNRRPRDSLKSFVQLVISHRGTSLSSIRHARHGPPPGRRFVEKFRWQSGHLFAGTYQYDVLVFFFSPIRVVLTRSVNAMDPDPHYCRRSRPSTFDCCR